MKKERKKAQRKRAKRTGAEAEDLGATLNWALGATQRLNHRADAADDERETAQQRAESALQQFRDSPQFGFRMEAKALAAALAEAVFSL